MYCGFFYSPVYCTGDFFKQGLQTLKCSHSALMGFWPREVQRQTLMDWPARVKPWFYFLGRLPLASLPPRWHKETQGDTRRLKETQGTTRWQKVTKGNTRWHKQGDAKLLHVTICIFSWLLLSPRLANPGDSSNHKSEGWPSLFEKNTFDYLEKNIRLPGKYIWPPCWRRQVPPNP